MVKETEKNASVVEKQTEVERMPKEQPRVAKEFAYPTSELAANAEKIFATRPECVSAALRAAGKTECTVSEAKVIVGKFLKKEVK